MNKINTRNQVNNNNKPHNRKHLGYALMITTLLGISNSTEAKISNKIYNHGELTEVLDTSNIINNIEKRTGVKIPNEYTNKLNNFVTTNEVMTNYIGVKFTEDFIVNKMQNDRGINKENQLLFIRSAIYKQITNEDLYNGSDGNDERLGDFMKVINNVKKCGKDYVNGFNTYMQQRSADAQQRSADAQQRSADAQQRSADAQQRSADAQQRSADAQQRSADAQQRSAEAKKDIMQQDTLGLKEMAKFYSLYIKNPNNVRPEEIEKSKRLLQRVIPDCKKYGINYRAILLKEVGGDAKKVDEILKFYGVE